MRPQYWTGLAAPPLVALLVVDILRSEDPLFWTGAAFAAVAAVTAFHTLVLRPILAPAAPARRSAALEAAGLASIWIVAAAAMWGAPHSEWMTVFLLSAVLQPLLAAARGAAT